MLLHGKLTDNTVDRATATRQEATAASPGAVELSPVCTDDNTAPPSEVTLYSVSPLCDDRITVPSSTLVRRSVSGDSLIPLPGNSYLVVKRHDAQIDHDSTASNPRDEAQSAPLGAIEDELKVSDNVEDAAATAWEPEIEDAAAVDQANEDAAAVEQDLPLDVGGKQWNYRGGPLPKRLCVEVT